MKKKSLLILIAVLMATGLGAALFFVPSPAPSPVGGPTPTVAVERDPLFGWKFPVASTALGHPGRNLFDFQIAFSDLRDPGGIPSGLPVRLKIPVIGVNSAIEDAYITPDGRMDVPEGSVNVAWFALGPQPGEQGSAVIGGHFGIRNGVKFVFYDLDKLKIGDRVYVVDDRDDTHTFVVRTIRLFNRDDDATPVFISNDGLAHLNVITCEGIWNRVNDTYPQRRVIFTDEIATESVAQTPAPTFTPVPTPVRTPTPSPTTTPRPTPSTVVPRALTMGSQGADVAELQTVLVERGFLTLPGGFVKGTFGSLTSEAVARYQTSVGLPSTGIYDQTTRVSLESAQLPTAGEPTSSPTPTPTPVVTPNPTPTSSPSPKIVQFVKSLYDSPVDGIITTLLLVSIGFSAYRIFKRH